MYSVVGIREPGYRVWKHVICIKNVGAVAYNTSKCNDGTSLRCSACAFAPCCKMSKKALVLSDFIKTL